MSSFNYFKSSDAFRFIVKVENTKNDRFIDVLEVGVNDPPKAKDIYVTAADKYHNYTMRTLINLTSLNPVGNPPSRGWYDNIEDPY
jgi:hypothetical protein